MNDFQESFMRRAVELARRGMQTGEGGPFGAVIVREGKVLAEGSNRVLVDNDPTAHAEVVAIRRACEKIKSFQLDDCQLYTSCEPCPMCLGAIYWARPRVVYFANTRNEASEIGFDDNFIYHETEKFPAERAIPFINVPHPEARAVFAEWFDSEHKVQY
jgi:tRNA(Arg) A34 adenosine deaminase TadA